MLHAPLVCRSFEGAGDQARGKRNLKQKGKSVSGVGLAELWIPGQLVPPSMSMEFRVRNYVCVVRVPLLHRDWDGGQIASRALDEPCCPAAV